MVSIRGVAVGACILVIITALLLMVDALILRNEQDYMRLSIILGISFLILILSLWFLYGLATSGQEAKQQEKERLKRKERPEREERGER